ncbi:histidine kinase dimerization/phosphoacceptor domain -containing protein [Litorisediminicola beolgyonensis]|uniref:histidine kinase n=1 Tax=Litorisediminicola beolgyonensis TaxID=1173614 RepID=A0ABW3ZJW5_9RHOB
MGARIIAFLSIALVPLGLVAYYQTAELERETQARAQLSLVALAESATTGERRLLAQATGAAQALGTIDAVVEGARAQCDAYVTDFREKTETYSFVGVFSTAGQTLCSSSRKPFDLKKYPEILTALKVAQPALLREEHAAISGVPVVAVMHPFFDGGELKGHVLLSIPAENLRIADELEAVSDELEDVVIFNSRGQVLSASSGSAEFGRLLPKSIGLGSLSQDPVASFFAESADGETRVYAVAPLIPGRAWSLGIWPGDSTPARSVAPDRLAISLPFLMWVASVIVAYLAVNRLVIRHIRTLRYQMRSFARDRRVPAQSTAADMALELRDMENDFLHMASSIMQDEAQLENSLREKTILLKEVHHRVKNNLQLISSIMNMQIRNSDNEETRLVLKRLQERIRGLATIHRNLYQAGDLGHVDARDLLRELIEQTSIGQRTGCKIELETDLAPVELYPDQAVPLSLLTAEALTNADKYMEPGADGVFRVGVCLERRAGREIRLEVSNSAGDIPAPPDPRGGLGTRLMRAFATQLGGSLEQAQEDGIYRVRVDFQTADFKPEVVDY